MAAYLVNKALDGDANIIKSTSDVFSRGKAKALLIKINKGTAERPPMPEQGAAPQTDNGTVISDEKSDNHNNAKNEEPDDDLIARLVADGVNGNMDEINSLENRVLRGKIKAAIVKAKRSK